MFSTLVVNPGDAGSPFRLCRYNDMEYLGEITDIRQHEHQVNVVHPAGKNEYVWAEKSDIIILWKILFAKLSYL